MTQKRQYWIAIPLSFVVLIGLFSQRPSTIVFAGFTPTPTPTNTPIPPTDTPTPVNTPSPTPTNTPLPGASNTPTPTATPVVGTPDPVSSPTPGRSTNSISTPSAIPALGNGPRASDLLIMGGGLLLAMGLLTLGWRKVWQALAPKNK